MAPRKKPAAKQELAALPPVQEAIAVATRNLNAQTAARFNAQKAGDLKWQVEKMYALQIIERATSDQLAKAVMNNPMSLVTAILDAGSLGLTLSPAAGLVYLIPESPKKGMPQSVNAKMSYKGMEQAVLYSGTVKGVSTVLVYQNDTFELGENEQGSYAKFTMARGDRGECEGGFCKATYTNGFTHVEWMDMKDIMAVQAAATKKNFGETPFTWTGGFKTEMWKKAIVRRAAKHWPRSAVIDKVMTQFDKENPMDFTSDPIEGEAQELLSASHVEALDQMLGDAIIPTQRAVWMQRQAEALGYPSIEHVPMDRLEEVTKKLAARRDLVLNREKARAANVEEEQ